LIWLVEQGNGKFGSGKVTFFLVLNGAREIYYGEVWDGVVR